MTASGAILVASRSPLLPVNRYQPVSCGGMLKPQQRVAPLI
jgi:hypothetical protein